MRSNIPLVDNQLTEFAGRNRLILELLEAGLEVAVPIRDQGIDLIAYADQGTHVESYTSRPIQMKAATARSFSINKKYDKFPGLVLAYVWYITDSAKTVTYAMTYSQAVEIADAKGYTLTSSWIDKGYYANNAPGSELLGLLEPYKMTPAKWWILATGEG